MLGLEEGAPAMRPAVSILIVARNTGPFIGDAILSARQQTCRDIEIVVVDDASTDDTRAIAERHAAQDARVRVLDGPQTGLAAVRNASLSAARGRWAAILDSDDLLHPAHVARLVAAAERTGATLVSANMVSFNVDEGLTRTALFADAPEWRQERDIDLLAFVRSNGVAAGGVSTGYLKPLFALDFLRAHGLEYDLRLRIGEDYDLVARALAKGARYVFLPRPTYFYRRHAASTSHRTSLRDLDGLMAAADALPRLTGDAAVLSAVAHRTAGIASAQAHVRSLDALKARRPAAAIRALGTDVAAWRLMARSFAEGGAKRVARLTRRSVAAGDATPAVLVIGDEAPGMPGHRVIVRAAPADDAARAALADGLPPLERIVVVPPATQDDAGYAMAPALTRVIQPHG
ncbi:glycosyltransferase family 2 protein [Sphingomonas adhaesiva]|uniref:glycosyltransferase family 2 protein n=1 Tax=Sphingomonas adhaesiva TaxID=28212 RepID=UPI002FF73D5E